MVFQGALALVEARHRWAGLRCPRPRQRHARFRWLRLPGPERPQLGWMQATKGRGGPMGRTRGCHNGETIKVQHGKAGTMAPGMASARERP